MNELQMGLVANIKQGKTHFKVQEGSNYKITDSYEKEYVIDYDHFVKLLPKLVASENQFITINDSVVNKRYIYKVEPTRERTWEQQMVAGKERAYSGYSEDENRLKKFQVEYFDKKFGENKWVRFGSKPFQDARTALAPEDITESIKAYQEQQAKEIVADGSFEL